MLDYKQLENYLANTLILYIDSYRRNILITEESKKFIPRFSHFLKCNDCTYNK